MRNDPLGSDRVPDKLRDGWPAPLADLLPGLTSRKGWRERLEEARVHDVWEEVAGAELAAHVWPVRLHGGVLVLEAESAAWATQIRYLSGDLARKANEVLGGQHVTQVRVVSGSRERGGSTGNR